MADSAISVRGLGRRFGEIVAVRDLHFDVAAGELFGIVGDHHVDVGARQLV